MLRVLAQQAILRFFAGNEPQSIKRLPHNANLRKLRIFSVRKWDVSRMAVLGAVVVSYRRNIGVSPLGDISQ